MKTALFDLQGRVAIITGGAGFLAQYHAEAILEAGAIPVLVDIQSDKAATAAAILEKKFSTPCLGLGADITSEKSVRELQKMVLQKLGRIDILVNNAANNPKMEANDGVKEEWSRLENFSIDAWNRDLSVGLTGAFICSKVFGATMASQKRGVILNILSDLALIAPDQRIYRKAGVAEENQPVKPVSYSAVKGGLLALTRYLSTYWATENVRVNAISPAGVENGQDPEFVQRLSSLIPLGRMARPGELKGALLFLVSDASSYMTGANLVVDGGRTAW